MIQAAFIVGSAVFIFYDGFDRLIHPQVVEKTDVGIVIMVISLIITLLLIGFQRYVIKKTNSTAIIADSAHYNVDVLSNAAVILTKTSGLTVYRIAPCSLIIYKLSF